MIFPTVNLGFGNPPKTIQVTTVVLLMSVLDLTSIHANFLWNFMESPCAFGEHLSKSSHEMLQSFLGFPTHSR